MTPILYYRLKNPVNHPKAKNKSIVLPDAFQVFVDIDSDADLDKFGKTFPILQVQFGLEEEKRVKSDSGGWHIYCRARRELTRVERLLLQACLGSDVVRETLAFIRLETDQDPVVASCFFEKKDAQAKELTTGN